MGQTTAQSYFKPGKDLRGVEGWLLVLCLLLVFLLPLTSTIAVITVLRNMTMHLVAPRGQFPLTAVVMVNFGLGVYGFVAGMRLWLLVPGAPRFAKNYLIIAACSVIALGIALYAASMHFDILRVVLARLIYFAIWYPYLQKSRRVAATYAKV